MNNSIAGAAFLGKGLDYLGKGVNAFDERYLIPPNNDRMLALTEGEISTTPIRQTDAAETFGSNFAQFIQNFSVKAGLDGSYSGFTGSVETKFTKSSLDSIDTKFAQLSLISSGSILSVSSDPVVLKRHLSPDFKKALAEVDPKDLFEQYGTHVAVKVTIGGMISYYSYSKTTERQTDSEFEIAAKLRYKQEGAEVGANSELTTKEKEIAKTVEGSTHLFVNGGEEAARISVEKGNKDSYGGWARTIADNPGFLGFQPKGLFPIWKLAPTEERGAALELAFKQEAARQFQIRIFTHTGAVAQHPDARIRIPQEYKLLTGGAKDNWTGSGNLLTASYAPDSGSWLARGKDHWEVSPATMSVFAMGIYDNLDLWEVKEFSAAGGESPDPSAEVALAQDFIDKGGVLVGGGAQVGGYKLLTSSYPKNATTWAANATDHVERHAATITVYARGLRCKVDGVKIEIDTNHLQSPSASHPSEKCSPHQGFTLVGGGALVNYGGGPGNMLTSSYPENDKSWATSSKDHRAKNPATITAYAIGLKVS